MAAEENALNQQIIDDLYARYKANPLNVPLDWRDYFSALEQVQMHASSVPADADATGLANLDPATGALDNASLAPEPTSQTLASNVEKVRAAAPDDQFTPTRVPGALLDPNRSDLPPAPPSAISLPTSPYVARLAALENTPGAKVAACEDQLSTLRGPAKAIAKNMELSLGVPTATSVRDLPAKLLIENRLLINQHLASTTGGKVSFTHLIAYALVEALVELPGMNVRYELVDGKPTIRHYAHVGFGLAVDLPKENGERMLLVPVIHDADLLTFSQFVEAYQDLIERARTGKLASSDFQGATVTLTNPGTLGTSHSVPRLMSGQGLIVGVGATSYPAQWAGASKAALAQNGVGPVMSVTSTYDHRVIQGAASGELLRKLEEKLTGRDGFYERIFTALRVPYEPYEWQQDFCYDELTEKGKPARIAELIHAYRSRGHLAANIDPLHQVRRTHPDLSLSAYGLSVWDLDRVFPTGGFAGHSSMPLRDLLALLRDTYTRTVGIEYMHIQDPAQRKWIQQRIEKPPTRLTRGQQLHILSMLNQAEAFETFLQTKYIGQKRFSLEGGESLIPLLDEVLYRASKEGVKEIVIGMAHRGRLNVLANVAGKTYAQIFSEFDGYADPSMPQGSGDVKYHLGTEGIYKAPNGEASEVLVTLVANPSHLEAADGVTEGVARAKQDRLGAHPCTISSDESALETEKAAREMESAVVPVLIHGDAAFIGEGVVQETLNMSQLRGYRTGGTMHVIVNNQIGFTTGPISGRSTRYCTDMAKGLQVPIFHVNADDPASVVQTARLAFEFRQEFHKDIIFDLNCYRRRGHNEGDDPSMTQPVLYSLVGKIPTTRAVYASNLIGRGEIDEETAAQALRGYQEELGKIFQETREKGGWQAEVEHGKSNPGGDTRWVMPAAQQRRNVTLPGWASSISPEEMRRIGEAHLRIPTGFTPHPKMLSLLQKREEMSREGGVDWGMGEMLAYGSLLMEGTSVRLAGQDCRRGTFAHRHAVLHDHENGREWTPLNFLTQGQAQLHIYDSPLSEYGPLAFEYGYSVESPETLVIWEAQFGDFANCAQPVIDEFVCSSYQKWNERSGLVMLLPHGYEGQGPDHSSARIERFLQLAAQENMWICQPSTPANNFHMLRTQAYARPRRPLIAFEPKQLLRLPAAASRVEDFLSGSFVPVYGETDLRVGGGVPVRKVLLCSGRIYYDLIRERENRGAWDTAIIRVEQLYPLPEEQIAKQLAAYPGASVHWVQDEPANQGYWSYLALHISEEALGGRRLQRISRPESAAPSAGSLKLHKLENERLLEEVFAR